jgi:2-polyprenyl-3-methyl-5-hydroxy-6-metoxy-1,4-benzoquinol methylase
MNDEAKTKPDHWDAAWSKPPRARLPSGLRIDVRNLRALLEKHVKPGLRVLEIGCAPGKTLAMIRARLGAEVAGIDYSTVGVEHARRLFDQLGLEADLRCEEVFTTTFEDNGFDVVFSAGVIEHFDDPRHIVQKHISLCKPGGSVVITVPNFAGIYGRLERYFDAENLAIHNLAIMSEAALCRLTAEEPVASVRAYAHGMASPSLVNWRKKWPPPLVAVLWHLLNAMALCQTFRIKPLCPMLVLEIAKAGSHT